MPIDQETGSNASIKASDLCSTQEKTKNEDEIELDDDSDDDEDLNEPTHKKVSINLPPPKNESQEPILQQKRMPMNLPQPKNTSEESGSVKMDHVESSAPEVPVKKTLKRRNAAIYNADEQD